MTSFFPPVSRPDSPLARYRLLSSSAGVRVSPLQLGAMSIGDAWAQGLGGINKDDAFALLDAFAAAGGNFIDTANIYQSEQSETWLGEWMASRKNRDKIVLATKYTMHYRSHKYQPGEAPNYMGNHKKSMHLSVRDSLEKLQTAYIDILYVHAWDHSCSIKEIMDGLHLLVEQSKVLYLGISDTPAWIVSAANEYANDHGKTPFSVYQGEWNVMKRDFERDIIPMARHYGMALSPWGVIGSGKFKTKAQIAEKEKKGESLRAFHGPTMSEDEMRTSAALEKVSNQLGNSKDGTPYSISTVALAYVLAKAPRVFPIVGGRKIEHLKDNIRALEIRLSKEHIQELEATIVFDAGFPSTFIGEDPKVSGEQTSMADRSAYIEWVLSEKAVGYA